MRILIAAAGSRGDVAPYTGLGAGLRRAGYEVAVATTDAFAPLVRAAGLEFRRLPADARARGDVSDRRELMRTASAFLTELGEGFAAEVLLQPVGDLLGEPFLHLRAAGEVLDDPGELGQAEDPPSRQVADVGGADERQQVVLAHRAHRDGPGEHQFVVSLLVGEGGQVERPGAEEFGVRPRHPGRRAAQPFRVGPHPQRPQELPGGLLRRGEVDAVGLADHPQRRLHRNPVRLLHLLDLLHLLLAGHGRPLSPQFHQQVLPLFVEPVKAAGHGRAGAGPPGRVGVIVAGWAVTRRRRQHRRWTGSTP
ncbi:hypothetical protein GCM10010441_19650 [Kitasatospora paracochleata]|uniref:Glycosyltransferase family 28 N-terminal domain-containing protein n=1 Tax=Kitasatospora paracochleata TaxID=58354 RepID=A0ABT1J392_9ACTN|nr:hypothetical protein [Kitasatospora paracochleata]